MITKMTGILQRVFDDEARIQVGPLEYQVLVPEFVRRAIQDRTGQEITLHITEYLEGNPNQGRMVPRLIGFGAEIELEFFELFCTVDKVGVKKALKALGRPIKEIAEAIQRQDHRWLSTLPGVGAATAEKIVATLRKKVTRFSMLPDSVGSAASPMSISGPVLTEALDALMALGMSPVEARNRLDKFLASGEPVTTVEEILPKLFHKA
jgi:Holliday junction DNA helicase RuvA